MNKEKEIFEKKLINFAKSLNQFIEIQKSHVYVMVLL